MNKEKLKEYVEKHRNLIWTGIGIVGGMALSVIGVKCYSAKRNRLKSLAQTLPMSENQIYICPNWSVGNQKEIWEENGWINTIIEDLKPENLGSLGEELVFQQVAKEGSPICAIIGIEQ